MDFRRRAGAKDTTGTPARLPLSWRRSSRNNPQPAPFSASALVLPSDVPLGDRSPLFLTSTDFAGGRTAAWNLVLFLSASDSREAEMVHIGLPRGVGSRGARGKHEVP